MMLVRCVIFSPVFGKLTNEDVSDERLTMVCAKEAAQQALGDTSMMYLGFVGLTGW